MIVKKASAKNVDKDYGKVYGFSLVYSGNFLAEVEVEVDQSSNIRVQMGRNPFE